MKAKPAADELAALVDELGELQKEFAPHVFKAKRIEQLRRELRAKFADAPAENPCEAKGRRFTVLLGPRGVERRVNIGRLAKQIGAKALLGIATVTLAALETVVSPDLIAEVVDTERTGPRSLTVLELGGGH